MSRLLKKSFDLAKCKTLLQVAAPKIKILRNKHANAVKSLRADVARLLEKGQESSAKTQVDNVFREEKVVALYNLLEQFCQLVINRLESIKSQRECPPDLKEAVASLIYAATRCEEIGELKKVSSQLTYKYGTEFARAAKELRSGCGVNTEVIQNLSSLPLSSDVRMKLLKDVAVENKINWDYDTTIADTTKQPADLLAGPSHFPSGTEVLNPSILDKQKSASMSINVNQVNGRATGVLENSLSSHTRFRETSLDSPRHNMNQPAKTNTSSATKGVCFSSRATSLLDPYALAKSEGRMDYKFVSDYMGREHIPEECLNSTASVKVAQYNGHSTSPGSPNMHKKQISSAGRQEMQLRDLEAAAKTALASASEAAEAARAAVAMVRKESLGTNKSTLENPKKPAGRLSQSISVPVLGDSSSGPIRGDSSPIRAESRLAPTWDNSDTDFALNNYASEDTSDDLFKYVVFEENSISQLRCSQVKDSATLIGERSSKEVPTNPTMDNFDSIDAKEEEGDQKTSFGQKQDGFFTKMAIQQEKTVQTVSSVPQFDDYSSDEAVKEEIPFYPSVNASQKQQHESIFHDLEVHQHEGVQNECLVPQFDNDGSEEASEEETPFYLKGRAAMVKEDYSDGTAKAPSNLVTTSVLTDVWREEGLSSNEATEEEPSLHMDSHEEPLNSSTNRGRRAFLKDESAESVRSPSQSLKSFPRSEIDSVSAGCGLESSPLDSRYDKMPSLLSPSRVFYDYGDGDSPSQVRRNLKWGSAISEDLEFAFEKTIESYKPSSLEELSLQLPDSSAGLEDRPRASKTDFELSTQGVPSSPRKYQGMSRRSVRSTRSRQMQDSPSPTA